MALGKKIRFIRNDLGLTLEKLAERSGVDVGTISALEMRDSSRSMYAPQLARGLGVSLDDLLSDRPLTTLPAVYKQGDHPSARTKHYITFDVLNVEAAAGAGTFVSDHIEIVDQVKVLENWARKSFGGSIKHIRVITAKGDSMSPTFNDDDVLFVDETIKEYQGEGVYIIAMPDLRAKRLQRLIDGSMRIISDNATLYPPEIVKGEELNLFYICGKVKASWSFNRI